MISRAFTVVHLLPQYQCTTLHFAAVNGHEAACRLLIKAGAKVDAEDEVRFYMGVIAICT